MDRAGSRTSSSSTSTARASGGSPTTSSAIFSRSGRPTGETIAFATDRDSASFPLLRFKPWRIALLDLESGSVSVLPGQAGLNLNPQWAPDGRTIAYVSDRTGTPNVFLYDLDARVHYQLTRVAGAVQAVTELSPSITWARGADKLAFTYFENGEYTVWAVNNPRSLRRHRSTSWR